MKETDFNFTKDLQELEAITSWFESEEVDLDQALTKFERGMTLAAGLKEHLNGVENRVEKIKQKFSAVRLESAAEISEPEEASLELFNE